MSFGIYVHVPFCAVRCDYCDFATFDDRAHLIDSYVDACVSDLRRYSGAVPAATSVFFGGGTPSLLLPEQVDAILAAARRTAGAEVTLEANPDSVDAESLAGYRAAGVTRLSLGVQSTRPAVLAALGRTHRPEHVRDAVVAARGAGIEEISVDLIYGASGETPHDWRSTLDDVLDLGVDHVSAYSLTVEKGTPLARRVAAGDVDAPDEDRQADAYVAADSVLSAAGMEWYEISSWARPGHECRQNRLYWEQGDYLGIGAAAHGHTAGRRWWNVRTPESYIDRVHLGESPEAGSETLDGAARAEEALTLSLRTRAGASVADRAEVVVAELVAAALLERVGERVVLTLRGRLLASDLTARLSLAGAASGGR
ncbi:MAG: radical SAM family heme chaperone HemW [Acidimicrobiia bacterium]|nr:radical SAM family heme chaperone HemW [Acidimicrobiia bacterium]